MKKLEINYTEFLSTQTCTTLRSPQICTSGTHVHFAPRLFPTFLLKKAQPHAVSPPERCNMHDVRLEKFTEFLKFVAFVGKEWCFIIRLNAAYIRLKSLLKSL